MVEQANFSKSNVLWASAASLRLNGVYLRRLVFRSRPRPKRLFPAAIRSGIVFMRVSFENGAQRLSVIRRRARASTSSCPTFARRNTLSLSAALFCYWMRSPAMK